MDQVTFDTSEADARLRKLASYLSPSVLAKEGARAVNRGVVAARTVMSREIRKEINVRAGDIKDKIEITRATASRITATIKVDRTPLELRAFRPRETRKGLRVRIKKRRGLITIASGFLVEKWQGQAVQRAGDDRYPLRALYGPSVGSQSQIVWEAAQRRAAEVIDQRMRRGIERQVARANR
jgi:hypothetical protein